MHPRDSSAVAPVIEMTNISAGSPRTPQLAVVEGVNWTVRAGEFWAIAGLQGSGKTDFLMMTAGLTAPLAGEYRLFGEPMPIFDESRVHERLRTGLVFEGGQLFNQLTIRENIALPLRYHHNLSAYEVQDEVEQWLEALDLRPWADSTPGAVSRIWQKRAGLGRALVLKPELLLLDSPVSGMDLRHLNWWLGFLPSLAKGHPLIGHPMTIVVTTADLRPWCSLAGHFAVLRNRGFRALGDWEQARSAGSEHLDELIAESADEQNFP